MKKTLILSALVAAFALVGWIEKGMACNPTTYYGCSAEYKIAAQQRQFKQRQSAANNFQQLRYHQEVRKHNKEIARARSTEAARKVNAKNRAFKRHEDARKTRGKTSYLTQTSDGTWVQTEINRGKRRGS